MTTATDNPTCSCGAVHFEGAQHKPECPAYGPGGLPENRPDMQPQAKRRPVEDPGWDNDWIGFRFSPDVLDTRIEQYTAEGEIASLIGKQVVGIVLDVRMVPTDKYGEGTVCDLSLFAQGQPWNGAKVSFFCSTMLRRLITQVHTGETVEITRMPNKGQAHIYEVVVLE